VLVDVVGEVSRTVLSEVMGTPLTMFVAVEAGRGTAVKVARMLVVTVAVAVIKAVVLVGAGPKLATKGIGLLAPVAAFL
jgi:hypothetical protein